MTEKKRNIWQGKDPNTKEMNRGVGGLLRRRRKFWVNSTAEETPWKGYDSI